ncbi:MAG TPA: hypothetical protein VEL47_05920 [Myxococcota bacterium]|nr:hypothetical protein [Myxococcota bacterium]
MKRYRLISALAVFWMAACGTGEDVTKPRQNTKPSQDKGTSQDTGASQSTNGILSSPEFKEFKTDFAQKFAGFNSLSPEVLYQIIEAVPEQQTTWSCGLVQSSIARASASLALGLPIEHKEVAKCNIKLDYPLLIDRKIPKSVVAVLTKGAKAKGFDLKFEDLGGEKYFRVGADPRALPDYLNENKKLPSQIRASYVGKQNLDKAALVAMVEENLKSGMPLMVLSIPNLEKFELHYYSIFGVNANKNEVMVLETKGKGLDRILKYDIDDFINKMDAEDFRMKAEELLNDPALIIGVKLLDPTFELPPVQKIRSLPNYNMIKFTKSP